MLQARLNSALASRFTAVMAVAASAGEQGVLSWAERAAEDAAALGRLRDRDAATLQRLEDRFNDDFYREFGQSADSSINRATATRERAYA